MRKHRRYMYLRYISGFGVLSPVRDRTLMVLLFNCKKRQKFDQKYLRLRIAVRSQAYSIEAHKSSNLSGLPVPDCRLAYRGIISQQGKHALLRRRSIIALFRQGKHASLRRMHKPSTPSHTLL